MQQVDDGAAELADCGDHSGNRGLTVGLSSEQPVRDRSNLYPAVHDEPA
jgi:hypothetical protein